MHRSRGGTKGRKISQISRMTRIKNNNTEKHRDTEESHLSL
jgi:hypothetical protein